MPTKTDGGLEPSIKLDEKRFPYRERYSFQFDSIAFLISDAVRLNGFTMPFEINNTIPEKRFSSYMNLIL